MVKYYPQHFRVVRKIMIARAIQSIKASEE